MVTSDAYRALFRSVQQSWKVMTDDEKRVYNAQAAGDTARKRESEQLSLGVHSPHLTTPQNRRMAKHKVVTAMDMCHGHPVSRQSSKGFLILSIKFQILLIFAVYGIWEDLGAWTMLVQCVPMICLQF